MYSFAPMSIWESSRSSDASEDRKIHSLSARNRNEVELTLTVRNP